ncbi:MAG: hypothetical protein M1821_004930 [Bathelium mastoideum]|nr:MAG: hypothetical protein M1821_004930 [Bathelium mastoideum]KAI9689025.1 MAG: hypothetical protein M1822_000762 [Bathelium mastoideum]
MAKAWDPLITEGHCINVLVGAVVSAFVNSITDIVILILPQITIWRLQMPKKKKIQISLIFLVGVIACISAIIRVPFTIQLAASEDITWYTWKEGIWTYPEIASGIVAACLPSSAKFFQSLRETKLFAFFASRSRTAPKTLGASPGLGGLGSPKEGASPRSNARRHGALWPTSVYATLADGGEEATQLSTLRSDSEWEDKRGKGHQDVEMMSQETYELSDIDTRETVQKMVHDLEKGVY